MLRSTPKASRKSKDDGINSAAKDPATKPFPSEKDDYNGLNLRQVAVENNFKLPDWYFPDGTSPVAAAEIKMLHETKVGEDQLKHVDDEIGIFVLATTTRRNAMEFLAAYTHFPTIVDAKCYLHTTAGDSFSDAFVYLRDNLNGASWFSPATKTVFINIKTLNDPGQAMLLQEIQSGSLPLTKCAKKEIKLWTVIYALFHLMDADPGRFRETTKSNSPLGSHFVAGHSLEDFSRALLIWQHFCKQRRDTRGNKYSFQKVPAASKKPHGQIVEFLESHKAARSRRALENHQDPALLVGRTVRGIDASVGVSERLHLSAFNQMGPEDISIQSKKWGTVDPALCNETHRNALTAILRALHPCPTAVNRNPRAAMDPNERQNLRHKLNLMANEGRVEAAVGHAPVAPFPFGLAALDIGLYIKKYVGGWVEPAKHKTQLEVKHISLPFNNKIASEYNGIWRKYVSILWPQQHNHAGKQTGPFPVPIGGTFDPQVAGLLDTCALDMNNRGLLQAISTTGGWCLVEDDCQQANETGDAFMNADDCGASFIFNATVEDRRIPLPVYRNDFVRFLVAKSPIFSAVTAKVLEFVDEPTNRDKGIIIIAKDVLSQMQLACILEMVGISVVNLCDGQSHSAQDTALSEFPSGESRHVLLTSLAYFPTLPTMASRCHHGIIVGFPDCIEDLLRVIGSLYNHDQQNDRVSWTLYTAGSTIHGTMEAEAWSRHAQTLRETLSEFEVARHFEEVRTTFHHETSRYLAVILEIRPGFEENRLVCQYAHAISRLVQQCASASHAFRSKSALDLLAAASYLVHNPGDIEDPVAFVDMADATKLKDYDLPTWMRRQVDRPAEGGLPAKRTYRHYVTQRTLDDLSSYPKARVIPADMVSRLRNLHLMEREGKEISLEGIEPQHVHEKLPGHEGTREDDMLGADMDTTMTDAEVAGPAGEEQGPMVDVHMEEAPGDTGGDEFGKEDAALPGLDELLVARDSEAPGDTDKLPSAKEQVEITDSDDEPLRKKRKTAASQKKKPARKPKEPAKVTQRRKTRNNSTREEGLDADDEIAAPTKQNNQNKQKK